MSSRVVPPLSVDIFNLARPAPLPHSPVSPWPLHSRVCHEQTALYSGASGSALSGVSLVQVMGKFACKSPHLIKLLAIVNELKVQFDTFNIRHVLR